MGDWKQQLKNLKLSAEAGSKHPVQTSKAKATEAVAKRGDILDQLETLADREEPEAIHNRPDPPATSHAPDKRRRADIAVTKVKNLVRGMQVPTERTNRAKAAANRPPNPPQARPSGPKLSAKEHSAILSYYGNDSAHSFALKAKPHPRAALAPASLFRPNTDSGRVFAFPEWAAIGKRLQHPRFSGKGSPLPVRIGLDLGTAFTKVVVRVGDKLLPIEWSPVTGKPSTQRFVLPSFIHRSALGEYGWLGSGAEECIGNLKLPLISDRVPEERLYNPVGFLAFVIRYARAFLYRDDVYGHQCARRELRWELNIGCPTEPHEDPEIKARFRRLATAAWNLAAKDEVTESGIRDWLKGSGTPKGLEKEPDVLPEFVAQIASYLRSPQKRDGLHALIDIGAATIDVATFNVVTQEEWKHRIPIFGSAVKQLGTHFLLRERYKRVGSPDLMWDESAQVESSADFAHRCHFPEPVVKAADAQFENQVVGCVNDVLRVTKSLWGDPRSSAWREGLTTFVTGGGAHVEVYRSAVRGVSVLRELPLRNRHGSISSTDHARLTVALGLTEDAEDLARIVPFSDIPPVDDNPPVHNPFASRGHGDGEPG